MTVSVTDATPKVIQFENENEGRSYPFEDNSDLTSLNGIELPEGVITDLHITAPADTYAWLSSVYISRSMLSVCVSVSGVEGGVSAMSVTVLKDSFEPYMPHRLEKLYGSNDIGGIITFGDIEFTEIPRQYRFQVGKVRFSPSTVAGYVPAGLRKIVDPRTGESVNGDVRMVFSSYIKASRNQSGIRLSLEDGAAADLMSECDKKRPVNACGSTPISSINGVRSDEQKRIVLWFK